jgi:hypothetical protein
MLRCLAVAALVSLTAVDAIASPLPQDEAQQTATLPSTSLEVFTYRPSHCHVLSLLLVFHGLHRNVSGYRDDARALADSQCMSVVAPLFDETRFPAGGTNAAGSSNGTYQAPKGEMTPTGAIWTLTSSIRRTALQ